MPQLKNRISKKEIEKWLSKLKNEVKTMKPKEGGKDLLKNIDAYIYDCEHWIEKKDYVKAWEVVSFAWGLLEAGEELGALKKN